MERVFLIDGEKVSIPEEKIKHYYMIGDECFYKEDETLLKYQGKLYVSENGVVCDSLNCALNVPVDLMDQDGNTKTIQSEFVAKESEEGFIYNNQLYFCDMLEEVF